MGLPTEEKRNPGFCYPDVNDPTRCNYYENNCYCPLAAGHDGCHSNVPTQEYVFPDINRKIVEVPSLRLWRISFHGMASYPHLWCVDEGTDETAFLVRQVNFENVSGLCVTGSPVALGAGMLVEERDAALARKRPPNFSWIQIEAVAVFASGCVTFHGSGK